MLKRVTEWSLCTLPSYSLSPFLISCCPSEGVIAYYWSQFDIPVSDLEVVPEFSEERVLETLENGIKEQRNMRSNKNIKISDVTASCRYHQDQMKGSHQGAKEGGQLHLCCSWLQIMTFNNQQR